MITTPWHLTVACAIALLARPSDHGGTVMRPPLIHGVP